ncbi:MAG: MIP family channel protein [Clostridiales bacterium]|jgi:aquaporin Z|nr:MIP family channel protein [Clostridiales bacterium]
MKKYAAEGIGTAILVFMGCGSAVYLGCDAAGGHLAVALAFGLSIVATAYIIGSVSGCHINPAVSLAMLMTKKMEASDFIGYIIAQVIGAVLGAALLRIVLTLSNVPDLTGGLGANGFGGVGWLGAFLVEIILTFIFIFTILGVTSDPANSSIAGLVIGLTLTFVHIVGIPLTGTSVNPARSLGPALFAGGAALSQLWVFIVAPLVGAALAAVVYQAVAVSRGAAKERVEHRAVSAS